MLHIKDDFEDVRKPGRTLGTRSTSGAVRQGVDRERRIAVDHGALRFQPLLRDGWGRQGIAYGPLTADEPWAFSVGLLNGHNASQSGHLEQAYAARLATWLRAGGTQRSRERLWRWLRFGQHRLTLRQFAAWLLRDPRIHDEAVLDENLAVGFFPSAVPHAPSEATAGFVMHSSGEDNGELWVRCEGNDLAVLRGVPNVPLLLTVVQTNDLALYFASSVDGEVGGRSPHMRPVGLTSRRSHPPVFAGIHQSVLGQIGFRVDSRVYGVRVAHGAELARGFVGDLATDTGWKHLSVAAGVVRLTLDLGDRATPRISFGSEEESYELTLLPERLRLARAVGTNQPLAEEPWARPAAVSVDLLALEDGVHVVVGGVRRLEPVRLHAVTRLRIDSMQPESPGFSLRQVTIVPREVPIPAELQVPLPHVDAGQRVCVEEFFAGEPTELHRLASSAGQPWRKEFGKARVLIEPGVGAKVHDARSLTSRGRTIYTVPWSHRDFADLEIQVANHLHGTLEPPRFRRSGNPGDASRATPRTRGGGPSRGRVLAGCGQLRHRRHLAQ